MSTQFHFTVILFYIVIRLQASKLTSIEYMAIFHSFKRTKISCAKYLNQLHVLIVSTEQFNKLKLTHL